MKKISMIVLFVGLGVVSQAQIRFGVKAGANFFKFTGDDAKIGDVSPKYKVGFAAGALVNIPINETFSVQPEALYSSEGSMWKEDGEKLTITADYVKVPVLLQYNASGFYAETGPQIGFVVSAKGKSSGNPSTDVKDNFESTNFAWTVGFGFRMTSGFGVGARYDIGLSNLSKQDDASIKQSGFHIGVSYLFARK